MLVKNLKKSKVRNVKNDRGSEARDLMSCYVVNAPNDYLLYMPNECYTTCLRQNNCLQLNVKSFFVINIFL